MDNGPKEQLVMVQGGEDERNDEYAEQEQREQQRILTEWAQND